MQARPALGLEDVRQALLCLYSPAELARTRLGIALQGHIPSGDEQGRGELLRRMILDAIEQLRPRGMVAPSASEYRAYDCVTLRYGSGFSVEEIAEVLSLSPRAVYRDLRWGEGRLAELLASQWAAADDDDASAALREEIEALPRRLQAIPLAEVVLGAFSALAPLTARFDSSFNYRGPRSGVSVMATPGVLREAIVQALSAAVQSSRGGQADVGLSVEGGEARLEIAARAAAGEPRTGLLQAAMRILEAQGAVCSLAPEGDACLLLRLPLARPHRVLVVEDNPSAIALYERYLADSEWEPVSLQDGQTASDMVLSTRAGAVILDVMMPETDGWSVLQALKLHPRTRDVPVIICSVVDDPELGTALGATGYLTKPVTRPALLQALAATLPADTRGGADPDRRE